nr:MAG TPA: hypothetical protein [Caudoviricetes sp.]
MTSRVYPSAEMGLFFAAIRFFAKRQTQSRPS